MDQEKQSCCGTLCECHDIEESCFRNALGNGNDTVAKIFKAVGTFPKCGKCVPHLRSMLKEKKEAL